MGSVDQGCFTLMSGNKDKQRMHLTLVIFSLSGLGGGMERSATNLVNSWAERGYEVSVLTLNSPDAVPLYPLANHIDVRALSLNQPATSKLTAIKEMIRSAWIIRKNIAELKPDAVVAFGDQTCVLTIAGCLGFGLPVIVAERTHPGHYAIGKGWGTLRSFLYPRAAALVAQTSDISKWYTDNLASPPVYVIPNSVMVAKSSSATEPQDERKTVLGVGMLTGVKRFELLIKVFSSLAAKFTMWDLIIYGEGPDRAKLEKLIEAEGLSGRVLLPGRVENIISCMKSADLFVLTSRTEGFPNALCEAMVSGLPVISFDCPSGPADIIRPGIDGILVSSGDGASLAKEMAGLMENERLRVELGSRAKELSERFSLEKVMGKWEDLIDAVVRGESK